ncbi:MAG: hypothetical protein LUP99_01230 [Methanomicrobiales archaeon]|nr:hypothetical protein [Methanomicrobiales archaeon]
MGLYRKAAPHHGSRNERCAGKGGLVFPAHGVKGADGKNHSGGAIPFHGADLYPDGSQTRAGGSWDNRAGDQVYVVAI